MTEEADIFPRGCWKPKITNNVWKTFSCGKILSSERFHFAYLNKTLSIELPDRSNQNQFMLLQLKTIFNLTPKNLKLPDEEEKTCQNISFCQSDWSLQSWMDITTNTLIILYLWEHPMCHITEPNNNQVLKHAPEIVSENNFFLWLVPPKIAEQ